MSSRGPKRKGVPTVAELKVQAQRKHIEAQARANDTQWDSHSLAFQRWLKRGLVGTPVDPRDPKPQWAKMEPWTRASVTNGEIEAALDAAERNCSPNYRFLGSVSFRLNASIYLAGGANSPTFPPIVPLICEHDVETFRRSNPQRMTAMSKRDETAIDPSAMQAAILGTADNVFGGDMGFTRLNHAELVGLWLASLGGASAPTKPVPVPSQSCMSLAILAMMDTDA